MKRSTRRQILFFLLISGLLLKKSGIGLSIIFILPSVILFCIELIRSSFVKPKNNFHQNIIYIIFSLFLILTLSQLQYWIPNLHYAFEIWIAWICFSIYFYWKAIKGKTQLFLWLIITLLLSSAAFMNPRTYHNFYRASYYEDYTRRHYSEMENSIADMYIDRYKEPQPKVANDLFIKGREAQKTKDYDLALELYNAAMDKDPDQAEMYNLRGFFKLNRLELNSDVAISAVKDFDRAIKLKPEFADAYINRALALSYLGRHLRACYDYQVAKSLNPKLNIEEGWKRNCSRLKNN